MNDQVGDSQESRGSQEKLGESQGRGAARRRLLQLGALAVPAAITLRGGAAWAASIHCQIHIPAMNSNDYPEHDNPLATNHHGGGDDGGHGYPIPATDVDAAHIMSGEAFLEPAQWRYLHQIQNGQEGFSCMQSMMIAHTGGQ
ncbi:MAG: hypothetical protein ACOY99_07745 [Pseudomonadota bacterium]